MAKTNGNFVIIGGFLLGAAVILTGVVLAYASVDGQAKQNEKDITELKKQTEKINTMYIRQVLIMNKLDIEFNRN